MGVADQLTRALDRLGIPISGVAIVNTNDRTTWRIDYLANVTPAQRVTAESFKLTFDPDNDPAWVDEQAERTVELAKVSVAVGAAVFKAITGSFPTVLQRQQIKADAKTVLKLL